MRKGTLRPGGVVEGDAADRVLLPQQQVGQADGDRAAVFVLAHRAAAVAHAGGNVAQQRAAEVRVLFELLDVIAVLLRPDFPVDIAQVVAVGVFAVLAELDRLPEVRTAVHPGKEPFHHVAVRTLSRAIRWIASGCKNFLESGIACQLVFAGGGDRNDPLDQIVGRDALALGGETQHQPVPQHRLGQGLHVLAGDVGPALQQARALAPRVRNWTARGPAPQLS